VWLVNIVRWIAGSSEAGCCRVAQMLQRNRLAPARSRCTPILVPQLAGVTPMMQQRHSRAESVRCANPVV
jgi:hypothetical protein